MDNSKKPSENTKPSISASCSRPDELETWSKYEFGEDFLKSMEEEKIKLFGEDYKLSSENKIQKVNVEDDMVQNTDEDDADIKGVPEFWLSAFKNAPTIANMIEEYDEPILKHLVDVKAVTVSDPMSFYLEFHFEPNDYFTNDVLTKTYELKPEATDVFSFEGPEIVKCKGCTIDWKKEKNVTVKTIKKKQKHKPSRAVTTVTKTVMNDSFFNFFNPPAVPEVSEEQELDEETLNILNNDYEVGNLIKDKIIPHAVSFFTGENIVDDEKDLCFEEQKIDSSSEDAEGNILTKLDAKYKKSPPYPDKDSRNNFKDDEVDKESMNLNQDCTLLIVPNPYFYCFCCQKVALMSCAKCLKPYCSLKCKKSDFAHSGDVCYSGHLYVKKLLPLYKSSASFRLSHLENMNQTRKLAESSSVKCPSEPSPVIQQTSIIPSCIFDKLQGTRNNTNAQHQTPKSHLLKSAQKYNAVPVATPEPQPKPQKVMQKNSLLKERITCSEAVNEEQSQQIKGEIRNLMSGVLTEQNSQFLSNAQAICDKLNFNKEISPRGMKVKSRKRKRNWSEAEPKIPRMEVVEETSRVKRTIVLDASNIARTHGQKTKTFSLKGLKIAIEKFMDMGHTKIKAFIPEARKFKGDFKEVPTTDFHLLKDFEKMGVVEYTPFKKSGGRNISMYDDWFIISYAAQVNGVVISRDCFKDLLGESEETDKVIKHRTISFIFVEDSFILPFDPNGRYKEKIKSLLSMTPEK